MASNADHFIRALTAPPTRLSGAINSTSVNIGLESLEGIQSDTAVVMTIDRVDADGKLTPELTEVVLGTLGNNGLENVVRGVGGKKQAHKSGAVVEVSVASSEQWNRLVTALLKTHNQDGTLKEIDGSKIKDSSLDGSKIEPGSVKPTHIANSIMTISGSNEYTTDNNSTVKLDTVSSQVGDLLSLSDNSIIVGSGVSKILVSANIFIKTAIPTGYAWGTLNKNNINLGLNTIASVSGNFCSLSISPVLLDVSQGDKITAEFFDAPGGGVVSIRGSHSWLTAQVIA